MYSPPRLILALAAIMLIVACDDDDAAQAPRQLPPETPPNFYAVAPPPPPPNPAQIGVADFVSFGTTLVHNQTVTRNVTITNTGGEPLQITGIDVSGPQQYQVAHECAEPVAPGAACVAHVSFAPEEAGDFDGSLIVASASGLTRVPLCALKGLDCGLPRAALESGHQFRHRLLVGHIVRRPVPHHLARGAFL